MIRNYIARVGVILLFVGAGCGPRAPVVTEVEGVVLLDGAPLPHAHVEFVPELKHFGATLSSTATTDEAGKFSLVCNRKSEAGAVVGTHFVIVNEVALPIERRDREESDPEKQRKFEEMKAKLTNRPIPSEYATVGTTPLKVAVSKDKKVYELKLERKP